MTQVAGLGCQLSISLSSFSRLSDSVSQSRFSFPVYLWGTRDVRCLKSLKYRIILLSFYIYFIKSEKPSSDVDRLRCILLNSLFPVNQHAVHEASEIARFVARPMMWLLINVLILLLGLPQGLQDGCLQIYSGVVPKKVERCYAFPFAYKSMAVSPTHPHAPRP